MCCWCAVGFAGKHCYAWAVDSLYWQTLHYSFRQITLLAAYGVYWQPLHNMYRILRGMVVL